MGKMIDYKRPDGQSVAGYLAEPATVSGAPGIVVIQEWWGLNDQIKGVASGECGVALVNDSSRDAVLTTSPIAEPPRSNSKRKSKRRYARRAHRPARQCARLHDERHAPGLASGA